MSEMLLLVCVGCSIFSLISGLTLSSNGSFITTDAFYLVCDVQGTITSSITIIDPARSTAGLCLAPPLNCIPVTGNTMERDVAKGTVKIGIGKPNIQLPASEGSWSCTDGTVSHSFVVKIHSYTQPVIQTEEEVPITGTIITVLIGCIYPYPDEVKISYVKKTARNIVLKSQNEVKFDNGTSTNCPVPDTRAISMNGTFLLSTDNLNGKEALIAVAVFLNGIQLGSTGYSNFSILSEKGCDYSDAELFLGGFSCFLIVLIVSIIMLIILACKMLPNIFGDLKENKKIIIFVVFIVVALSIGLILGLVLKECDQRDPGLGLGLGLGFFFAAALVVTIYICHKKCNSKKGSQGGETEDDNGDNKNNTGTRSTATKAPTGRTRESQNNTGSNTTKNATERVGLKSEH